MLDGSRRLGRDLITGSLAALRAPRVIDSGLPSMLTWAGSSGLRQRSPAVADRPIRVALAALRVLSKVPGGRWRNTCLFRSVAECAIRREYGMSARIGIGVDRQDGDVVAHSWVEVAGRDERDSRTMTPLEQARASSGAG